MLLQCFLVLCVLQTLCTFILLKNNVCTTFEDYFHPDNNENCYYDPDTTIETPNFIKKYTGNVEIHPVTTEDGYIITMFRIPSKQPKGVILLHHSIAIDSRIYLWQGNNSLAVVLWRNGFDVWLANQRGTSYSDKHVNLTNQDYNYWDFSAHEMGVYDVSSELAIIKEKTNSKVIFLGHSLGSAVGLIYAAMKPKEAETYLKSMVLLGPPVYFNHTTSILRSFRYFVDFLESLARMLRMGSPVFLLTSLLPFSKIFLRQFPFILLITKLVTFLICGYTPAEADPTFFNYDIAMYLNSFSWKTFFHFLQMSLHEHRFQQYDYGAKKNLELYGEEAPPKYPLDQISVPILIVASNNDSLTTLKDAETLFQDLPDKTKAYGIWKINGLNHLDFHIGLHRNEIFRDNLIAFLNSIC